MTDQEFLEFAEKVGTVYNRATPFYKAGDMNKGNEVWAASRVEIAQLFSTANITAKAFDRRIQKLGPRRRFAKMVRIVG